MLEFTETYYCMKEPAKTVAVSPRTSQSVNISRRFDE